MLLNRRDFISGAAATAGLAAAGCRFTKPDTLPPYDDDLLDRCWMWGHETGQVDGPGNIYKLDIGERCYHMVEGARNFGLHNLNVIRWDKPGKEFRDSLKGMKRLTWPVSANVVEKHSTYAELGDYVFAAAEESENVTGFELDDYFRPRLKDDIWVDTPKGRVKSCPTVFPYSDLTDLRRRVDAFRRSLELRLVVYDELFDQRKDPADLVPSIDLATTCTYWTWNARNIPKLPEYFKRYRAIAPGKPTFLGIYLYDFGGCRHMPPELMKMQLSTGLDLFRKGEIEGFVFLCSSICNRPYPSVDIARRWIAEHADERFASKS